jgi:hypothetical protein
MDVESALFRIIDESITGFLTCHPDRISIKIEWSDTETETRIAARREGAEEPDEEEPEEVLAAASEKRDKGGDREIPEALKAMIDEQRADAAAARTSRKQSRVLALPPSTWREVQQRAGTMGIKAELVDAGREVVLVLAAR